MVKKASPDTLHPPLTHAASVLGAEVKYRPQCHKRERDREREKEIERGVWYSPCGVDFCFNAGTVQTSG